MSKAVRHFLDINELPIGELRRSQHDTKVA